MNDVISVIVPVYNVADYLPQCLDSILSQDHKGLDVILIDDGSTDSSGAICDDYAARDARIRVIHQKNAGAAAAKNAGLRAAEGQYLSFVDSDDYLEPGVYGYMLDLLKQSGADAAEFSFRDVYQTRQEDQVFRPGREIMTGKAYLVRFTQEWTCALLWNKLYQRSLFDGVFFEEGHKIDDEYFTYQGLMNADRILCDDRIIYNYRRRRSSVMQSMDSAARRIMDRADAFAQRRKRVNARFPELRKTFDTAYLEMLIYTSEFPENTDESIAFLKERMKQYFAEKGNTFPPKYLWKGLLGLAVLPSEKLPRLQQSKMVPVEDYFA